MTQRTFNTVAGLIFGLVAILHALRLFRGWEFTLDGWHAPMWVSWAGLALATFLSYTGLTQRSKKA